MKNRGIIASMTLLVCCFIYITACQDNVGTSFEESVVSHLDLQPIQEASNTTLNVKRGDDAGLNSFFAFDVSNVQSNAFVRPGLTEGWCLQWDKPLNSGGVDYRGIEMYSTFGSDRWKPANYLMSIKNELKANDPNLTYREIQVALWSVIDAPEFNLEKVLEEDRMPERVMRDGEPNFSVSKVKQIVDKVYSEFYDNYEYTAGATHIIYGAMGENDQDVGIVAGSETAWAVKTDNGSVDTDVSHEFCGREEITGANWGWYNGLFSDGDEVELDLYAGAGQCDLERGTFVGTFSFTYSNGTLDYEVNLTETSPFTGELYQLTALQIHVGNDILPEASSPNFDYTSAPGQFDTVLEFDEPFESSHAGSITGLSGDIYVAVHADILGFDPDGNNND